MKKERENMLSFGTLLIIVEVVFMLFICVELYYESLTYLSIFFMMLFFGVSLFSLLVLRRTNYFTTILDTEDKKETDVSNKEERVVMKSYYDKVKERFELENEEEDMENDITIKRLKIKMSKKLHKVTSLRFINEEVITSMEENGDKNAVSTLSIGFIFNDNNNLFNREVGYAIKIGRKLQSYLKKELRDKYAEKIKNRGVIVSVVHNGMKVIPVLSEEPIDSVRDMIYEIRYDRLTEDDESKKVPHDNQYIFLFTLRYKMGENYECVKNNK